MNNNQPIGLFDSGIGGTSIWAAIHEVLPFEDTVYLADSKNAPYGNKSKDEIISLCIKNTEFLLEKNAKLIVVACNTATTNAITVLREKYDVPFIGIEPAIKPAALLSKTQTIGVLATKSTLSSALFNKTAASYTATKIIEKVGHGLVELIEKGDLNSPEIDQLLQEYLLPMVAANIDYLVLGCSHYPYLIPQIKKIIPATIQIIYSGEAVAKQTQKVLEDRIGMHVQNRSNALFYTNSDPKVLSEILGKKYDVFQKDF